jgi:hypothetical protein
MGQLIRATGTSKGEFDAAYSGANDGDTIELPNGNSNTWDTTVSINKSIRVTSENGPTATVIIDGVDKTTASPHMFSWSVPTTGLPQLSGIGFDGGSGSYNPSPNYAMVRLSGSGQSFRMDHCALRPRRAPALVIYGRVCGVAHHCLLDIIEPIRIGMYMFNGQTWAGAADFGDGSWAEGLHLGGPEAFYWEDCTFQADGTSGLQWAMDGWYGNRVVVRDSTLTNVMVVNHGTESGNRQRGGRSFEYYRNKFTHSGATRPGVFPVRSGNGVIWGNTGTGNYQGIGDYGHYRLEGNYSWGMCNGINGWDVNDGITHASGTHTGSSGVNVLTDSTKSGDWGSRTANFWAGAEDGIPYVIRNLTQNGGLRSGVITSNTSTTITYTVGAMPTWNNGDSYSIMRPTRGIDQTGVGAGILCSGFIFPPGIPANPSPPQWLDQVDEPSYDWSNKLNGVYRNMTSRHPTIVRVNRDFYNLGTTPLAGYVPYTYPHPLRPGYGRLRGAAVTPRFYFSGR